MSVLMKVHFIFYLLIFLSLQYPHKAFSEESSQQKIKVAEFRISGNKVIDTKSIRLRLEMMGITTEKEYTLDDLKNAANAITNLYHQNGYILARAYIPQQEIADGIVNIAIIEGELGNIRVFGNKYYSALFIEKWFKHLKGRPVREGEVERAVLIANDILSLNATARFEKGERPETTDLIVNVKDKYPVQLEFEYDNYGHPLVSRQKYGLNFRMTDPLLGSTLALRGASGNSLSNTFYGGIDYSLPVSLKGTILGLRYIDADYIVGKEFEALGIQGETKMSGGYISHPYIRSRTENLRLTLGFDYKRMFEYILDEQISNDDLSVAYLRMDYDNIDDVAGFPGKNYISINYSHGFNKLFGALKEDDPAASRSGADGRFDKLNLDYARVQKLQDITLLVRGSGQLSSNKLVSVEEFSIGGANTVRGHALSTYLGDHGYLLSAEISSPLPFVGEKKIGTNKLSEMLRLVIFADHGGVYRIDPLAGEASDDYLSSAGIGARLYLFDRINLKLDIGYPVKNGKIETRDEIVYIQGSVQVLRF